MIKTTKTTLTNNNNITNMTSTASTTASSTTLPFQLKLTMQYIASLQRHKTANNDLHDSVHLVPSL